MSNNRKLMSPLSILMLVIVLAALATWLIPADKYDRLSYDAGAGFTYHTGDSTRTIPFEQYTLDSLGINIPLANFQSGSIKKPVSVPGTYTRSEASDQNFIKVLQAPVKGIYESIEIILFILVIGGFMEVFNESGAMLKGVSALSTSMRGKESWLIIILTFLFALGGASFGMAEEGFVFYPILIPIFLAAGYDLLVPVAVIFGGTQLGTLSSFTNPFSTIIASNAAGVSWTDSINERLVMFVITCVIYIWYVVRYASKVKRNPAKSLLYNISLPTGILNPPTEQGTVAPLDNRSKMLLVLFFSTFVVMIYGVVRKEWWLQEMTTLFLGAAILLAFITRLRETAFIHQFIKGAEGLLSVAFIIGVARGVSVILNDGNISDTIIYEAAKLTSSMPPAAFIVMMLVMYMLFTLFISSSSGMAVLTMPIMGSLAIMVKVPGREIVNAYLFGMGIMGFITPTGLILPALAISNGNIKAWLRFILPLILILLAVCSACLVIGIYLK